MLFRSAIRSAWHLSRPLIKPLSSSATQHRPAFPTVPSCPSPTCSCAEMPVMPNGLEIDHSKPLRRSMPAYVEHVLICTGLDDWSSRIEEENSGDNLAADIKEMIGKGGVYSDPYHNVLVTNCSFPRSVPRRSEIQSNSAYLLPSFQYVPFLPRVDFGAAEALVKGFVLPTKLHPAHDNLSPIHRDRLQRSEERQQVLSGVQEVKDVLILVCGHNSRDARCGTIAPYLRAEFEKCLKRKDWDVLEGPVEVTQDGQVAALLGPKTEYAKTARIGSISHIGGHKFAGNVIIYIPPGMMAESGEPHALAGCGIWYGRVQPNHAEGIVQETVLKGFVIEELFRGGIRQGGELLRI